MQTQTLLPSTGPLGSLRTKRLRRWSLYAAGGAVVAALLIALEVVFLSRLQGMGPNTVSFPMLTFAGGMFSILLQQNAWEAVALLLREPVVEIAHYVDNEEFSLWRAYYYGTTVATHWIAGILWMRLTLADTGRHAVMSMLIGAAGVSLLVASAVYVNLVAHCSGPTWMLDTLFRAWESPLSTTARLWERSPLSASTVFQSVQWGMALAGTALLVFANWKRPRPKSRD